MIGTQEPSVLLPDLTLIAIFTNKGSQILRVTWDMASTLAYGVWVRDSTFRADWRVYSDLYAHCRVPSTVCSVKKLTCLCRCRRGCIRGRERYRPSTPSYYPLAVGHATFSVDCARSSPSGYTFEVYKVQCLRRATVQQLSNVEPYSRLTLTLIRNGHRPKSRSSSG